MTKVVISQSMYFPWPGLLEQIVLADKYVFYDDVDFVRKSFTNRVQIKTQAGQSWITVPVQDFKQGQKIDEVKIDYTQEWQKKHYESFRHSYAKTPYIKDALDILDEAFSHNHKHISDLAAHSIRSLVSYFELGEEKSFLLSKDLGVPGASTQRLLDIVKKLEGNIYITGHGAKNYLDHSLFDEQLIDVRYMEYKCIPYSQKHGDFIPYVSSLDLIANCGKDGKKVLSSGTVSWKEALLSG